MGGRALRLWGEYPKLNVNRECATKEDSLFCT